MKNYLNENIDNAKRYDHYQKDRSGKTDGDYGANNSAERPNEGRQCYRNLIVNCTDVLREAVHDPPKGGGLEKRHG